MSQKTQITIFAAAALIVLLGVMSVVVHRGYSKTQNFDTDCKARGGEVARQAGSLICVDPLFILMSDHADDDHTH